MQAKLNYHVQLHYTSGMDNQTPRLITTERKVRKDEGSFKKSTALKLAGLTKAPDNLQMKLTEVHEELRATLSELTEVPEDLQSALSSLNKAPEDSHSSLQSSPPLNLSVKTEFIEVEVDIPEDI